MHMDAEPNLSDPNPTEFIPDYEETNSNSFDEDAPDLEDIWHDPLKRIFELYSQEFQYKHILEN